MKIKVYLEGGSSRIHDLPEFVLYAEANDNGDLTVYKDHYNMLAPKAIANYAAGIWTTAEVSADGQEI